MGEVIHLTDANFDQEVVQSSLPTLTDFWAAWCGPCKMIAPIVEQLAQEYEGKMKVTKLDVDQNPTVATRFGVMSIPTLILFKNGQPVERIVGYMPKEKLVERLKPHLG
ncbi:MAG: thioredoxin [Anaerolineae bacterium]